MLYEQILYLKWSNAMNNYLSLLVRRIKIEDSFDFQPVPGFLNPLKIIITHSKALKHKSSLSWTHSEFTMSTAVNWVLLQLAMSYYGDSLKEFQVDSD